jgi:hypothetical protein
MNPFHEQEIRKFYPEGEIYLHGSRRKAAEIGKWDLPEGTDYDYAVDYLEIGRIEKALGYGWKECVDKSYLDSNSSVVLETNINGDKVQVSARQSLERYKKAFEDIPAEEYFYKYWKKPENKDAYRAHLEELYRKHDPFLLPWA